MVYKKRVGVKFPWWMNSQYDRRIPIFLDMGFIGTKMLLADKADWYYAREQLWSMREGLG